MNMNQLVLFFLLFTLFAGKLNSAQFLQPSDKVQKNILLFKLLNFN